MDPDVGQVMRFSESMQYIEERGFRLERFGDIFPFGPRIHSEGEWQRLMTAAVKSIESAVDRELLLDLIDAQLCVSASVAKPSMTSCRRTSGEIDLLSVTWNLQPTCFKSIAAFACRWASCPKMAAAQ